MADCRNPTNHVTMTKTTANDHQNETIMDVNLLKIIGLYRLLHKSSAKIGRWGTGDRYRILLMVLVWLVSGLLSLQFIRLCFALTNLQQFIFFSMTINLLLPNMIKAYVLMKHSDRLLALMDVTWYTFTLCSRQDSSYLRKYRDVLYIILRSFAVYISVGTTLWILTPLFLPEYVPLIKVDGTVGIYRLCMFNTWLPLSETVYNLPHVWALIYLVETVASMTIVTFSLMFDCYFVTMCIALDAHLRTITAAYATLGGGDLKTHRRKGICTESEYYNELILYIKCNQQIIKIYDEFYDIIQPIVIFKIMCEIYISVALIYFSIMLCLTGSPKLPMPVMKNIIAYGVFIVELYMYCYVFDHLETTKSKLNNGLWNGNWTERDLKFRKILLIAMIMNSSHNRKMKGSPTWIVNLEMFMRIMKMSYTIVSALINTRDKYT